MATLEASAGRIAFGPNWWARAGWLLLAAYIVYACSLLDFTWARFMIGLDNGARFFKEMRNEARAYFNSAAQQLRFTHSVDMRYRGQEHTVNVACDPASWEEKTLREAFDAAHERSYTFRIGEGVAELVTYRLRAELDIVLPGLAARATALTAKAAPRDTRTVWYDAPSPADWPVYERAALPVGAYIEGPGLVEDAASTSVLLSGQCLSVDPHGLLLIRALPDIERNAAQR